MARYSLLRGAILPVLFVAPLYSQSSSIWKDPSPHVARFVTVDTDVRLEVLDWGGSGRSVVLLSGLGNTAHIFDDFAPKLTANCHVYGITRRGYGASSIPSSGYTADRLGDDVLAVLDSLKLSRPVLVGHSIAGEEMSSLGTRHPDRIAGLVYLDAGYWYAYDSRAGRELRDFDEKVLGTSIAPPSPGAADLKNFPALLSWYVRYRGYAPPEAELRQGLDFAPDGTLGKARTPPRVHEAIEAGEQSFMGVPAPVLAIFVIGHDRGPWSREKPNEHASFEAAIAMDVAQTEAVANAFQIGVPTARVVKLKNTNHYVFMSNEADVLRELRVFLAGLH